MSVATMKTSEGDITIELFDDAAPRPSRTSLSSPLTGSTTG